MEFLAGIFLGYFALPWFWMLVMFLVLLLDVALTEAECFGWGTFVILVGMSVVAYFGADINLASWTWENFGYVVGFFTLYLGVGAGWFIYYVSGGKRP